MGELIHLAAVRKQKRIKTSLLQRFTVTWTQAIMRWLRPCTSCAHSAKQNCDKAMCPYGC